MAQSSPLRNRTPATAPANPEAAVPSKWAARLRLAGRSGGAVAGLAAEGARLGQIDAEQGSAAMRAELPRSAGRLGAAWAGAEAGGAMGAMTGPLAPVAAPVGALIGGAAGYTYGDKAVDALPRVGRGIGSAMAEVRNAGREGGSYLERAGSTAQSLFDGRVRKAFSDGMQDPPAPAAEVSPARNRAGADWRAPMQLPAGSKPEGWSLKPVVPNGMPTDWSAPMKLPSNYPKAPEPTAPARDPAAEAAMRYAAAPDVVQAAGAQDAGKAEAAGMRSAARIQDYGANARSTITGNALNGISGDTNELMRRMHNDLTSYTLKGFPSLRAQRAEMWNGLISQANGVTAKGADNAAAADMQGMKDANESQRAFSERKNKVNMFNVGTSEERRAGDLDRQQKLIESVLGGGARGADKYADSSFAGKLYEDYLKVYKDPALAAQMANRGAVAAGDTADSPVMSMAQAMDADNLQRGMRAHADRWFGLGNRAFDANSAQPVAEADWTDSWLPGGVDSGDIKLRDANGNETWAARSTALPPGEDFTAFSQRLARQRELARLRNGGK